jgi:hypothetical protein
VKRKKRYGRNVKPQGMGHANNLIDTLLHPFLEEHKSAILVDGALHAIVEQNPSVSLKKFAKYSLPELFKPSKKRKKHNKT